MTTTFTARLTALALTVFASAALLVGAVGPATQSTSVTASQVA